MNLRRRSAAAGLTGVLAVLWGALVAAGYYWVHKPIASHQLAAAGQLLLTLLGWLVTLSAAYLLGAPWLARLEIGEARSRLVLRLGAGFGMLGLLMLLLGAAGGYYRWLVWLAGLAALPWGAPALLRALRGCLPQLPSGALNRLLAAFVALLSLLTLLKALTPPTAWDALVYHLSGPKLYLEAHRLEHAIDLPYLGFPHFGSMLFTWGLLLANPQLGQLIHYSFFLMALMLLPDLVRRLAPGRSWLAAALMVGVPSALMLAAWAYVEWISIFAALAAFRLLIDPALEKARPGYWLGGGFVGLALAAKYNNLGVLLGLMILLLLDPRRRHGLLWFAAGVALSLGPYLLKNLLLTGNPVYPFFLPGKFWDASRAFWYSRGGSGLGVLRLLLAPWEATVGGVEGGAVSGFPPYSATIGPLLLMLSPFALLGWRQRAAAEKRLLGALLVVCLSCYALWLALLSYSALLIQTRLIFIMLPFICIFAVVGLDRLRQVASVWFRPDVVLTGLVVFSLLLTTLAALFDQHLPSDLAVISGAQTQPDYLQERLGLHAAVMARINQLPPGSKVVFLWEPRSFYCSAEVRCEPDALLDRWWHLRQRGWGAAEAARSWLASGATHVLVFVDGAEAVRAEGFDPLQEADWIALSELQTAEMVLLEDFYGAYALYTLDEQR